MLVLHPLLFGCADEGGCIHRARLTGLAGDVKPVEARFRHDQGEAAENGWYPVARDFAPGGSLRVTYRKVGRSEWAA